MFCQEQIIGKEIYLVRYVSFSFSVFFSQNTEVDNKHFYMCCGLTSAGGQTPTQLLSHSPSSAGLGEKIKRKSLCVKIKAERLLVSYHYRQNGHNMGRICETKAGPKYTSPCPPPFPG